VRELRHWPPGAAAARSRRAAADRADELKVAGFVFKVQATWTNHRDRAAFLPCSGVRRGMKLTQMGTGKVLSVNSPILFFAREREIVDEAWPGDIMASRTTRAAGRRHADRRRDGQDHRHPQHRA
jgi:peptide subunit release factor RF-3